MRRVQAAIRGREQLEKPTAASCGQAKAWKEGRKQKEDQAAEPGYTNVATKENPGEQVEQCGS